LAQFVGTVSSENIFAYFISPGAFMFAPGMQFYIACFIIGCTLVGYFIVFAKYDKEEVDRMRLNVDQFAVETHSLIN
jgi:hypothetical protein